MLRVNVADGSTLSFDLGDARDVERWRGLVQDPSFQSRIRGLQLVRFEGEQMVARAALPVPSAPGRVTWDADLVHAHGRIVRERAIVYVAPFRVITALFLGEGPPTIRTDVERVGRLALPAPRRPG